MENNRKPPMPGPYYPPFSAGLVGPVSDDVYAALLDAKAQAEAAETAKGKAEDAQEAAETAQGKAEDAQEAAEEAQGKAEDAQEAAETAQEAAEAWATGGSGGTASATNNAKYYSEQAAASAATLVPDPTLTQENQPAEAAATGTRIGDMENVFDVVHTKWVQGRIGSSGQDVAANYSIRTGYIPCAQGERFIKYDLINNSYRGNYYWYDSDKTYLSFNNEGIAPEDAAFMRTTVNLGSGNTITPSDGVNYPILRLPSVLSIEVGSRALFSQNSASRTMDIPITITAGDKVFGVVLEWGGETPPQYNLKGYQNGSVGSDPLVSVGKTMEGFTYDFTEDYEALRIGADLESSPSSAVRFKVLLFRVGTDKVSGVAYSLQKEIDNVEGRFADENISPIVGIYGAYPVVEKTSENAYAVTIKGYTRYISNGKKVTGGTKHNDAITLEHNQILVYDPSDDTFSVITTQANYASSSGVVPLLFNTYGALYGPWSQYVFEADTDEYGIPEYYTSHLATKIAQIKANALVVGKNGGTFIFVTDYHIESNTRNSPALVEQIMKQTGIRNVVFGGDAIQSQTTPEKGYDKLCEYTKDFSGISALGKFYQIIGNHEYNDPSTQYSDHRIPRDTIYNLFTADTDHIITPLWDFDNLTVTSFYTDDKAHCIRYYFVGSTYNAIIASADIKAVCKSMEDVPEGYSVLIISHMGLANHGEGNDDPYITTYAEKLCQAGAALNDGESVTIDSVAYDYTDKARTFVGIISGHNHRDNYVVYDSRFPVISTTCDARGVQGSHMPGLDRTAGTVNEQAFDVVQFDIATKRIYMTRIGANENRVFAFGEGAGPVTE